MHNDQVKFILGAHLFNILVQIVVIHYFKIKKKNHKNSSKDVKTKSKQKPPDRIQHDS